MSSEYAQGFLAGMRDAARTLREAANGRLSDCQASKKVLESQAHQLAAALLASWANGLEINAETACRAMGEPS